MFADEARGGAQKDLPQRISARLIEQVDIVTADALALLPFYGTPALDSEYCQHVSHLIAQLLALAVRDSRVDPRGAIVGDLHRLVLERALPVRSLFTIAYLVERAAVDELALDAAIGATSDAWPQVAQLVRRGSFDLLAGYVERAQSDPAESATVGDKGSGTLTKTQSCWSGVVPKVPS